MIGSDGKQYLCVTAKGVCVGHDPVTDSGSNWKALGGGGAGASVVRKFPFAYNTPGILTGAALYTPTVGDILLDAWVEITTAWDGTTPRGDVGIFVGIHGIFALLSGQALDMTHVDNAAIGFQVGGQLSDLVLLSTVVGPTNDEGSSLYSVAGAVVNLSATAMGDGNRFFPAKFVTANPFKVCVSQDGTNTGADPGSTQGAAILYLVTATPV